MKFRLNALLPIPFEVRGSMEVDLGKRLDEVLDAVLRAVAARVRRI